MHCISLPFLSLSCDFIISVISLVETFVLFFQVNFIKGMFRSFWMCSFLCRGRAVLSFGGMIVLRVTTTFMQLHVIILNVITTRKLMLFLFFFFLFFMNGNTGTQNGHNVPFLESVSFKKRKRKAMKRIKQKYKISKKGNKKIMPSGPLISTVSGLLISSAIEFTDL